METIKFAKFLVEANFTRAMNILRGDVPTVKTVAILTAENPLGQKLGSAENKRRNSALQNNLKSGNLSVVKLGSRPIMGKFGGNIENSFLIPHVTREYAIYLAITYGQKAVIWGERQIGTSGEPFIRFEYIETDVESDEKGSPKSPLAPETYKTTQTRDVVLSNVDKGETDYSAMKFPKQANDDKARKFVIPFFNPNYEKAQYEKGKRTIQNNTPMPDELRAAEGFHIPFFDDLAEGVLPIIDVIDDVSLVSSKLPQTPEVQRLVKRIQQKAVEASNPNLVGKAHWAANGNIRMDLQHLQEIIHN